MRDLETPFMRQNRFLREPVLAKLFVEFNFGLAPNIKSIADKWVMFVATLIRDEHFKQTVVASTISGLIQNIVFKRVLGL